MKTKNLNSEVEQFAALNYTIIMRNDDEGDVIASIKELDGCIAHGHDHMEAIAELESVKRLWIKSCLTDAKPVPVPREDQDDLPSGKWLQRVPRTLHRKLIDVAKDEDVSLNTFVTSCLSEAVGKRLAAQPGIAASIQSSAAYSEGSAILSQYFIASQPRPAEQYRSASNLTTDIFAQQLSQQINLSTRGKRERPSHDLKEVTSNYAYQA